jgi:predicted ATPase
LEIDRGRREVRRGGVVVPLGERAFDVLAVLAGAQGEVVSKADLMALIWPGAVVEDNALQAHISAIRKALGPDRDMLKTVSRRGYCLSWDGWPKADPPDGAVRSWAPSNLRGEPPQLIGRGEALETLKSMLRECRSITITGPGGIGKTALSLSLAQEAQDLPCVGGYFVDLAPIVEAPIVASVVAQTLGLRSGAEIVSAGTVAGQIGEARLLLLLDNCEHLIDAVAPLCEMLLRACPNILIIATSREPLRVMGEHVYRLAPLDVPALNAEAAEIYASSAVRMFVARFRAAGGGAGIEEEETQSVAEICRRLDGIPLAIEFAAARAAVLGVAQVAKNLDDRFQLLTGGRRTALPRQKTLRATLDWSYDLLSEAERRLLRHLAVFPGGFTSDAAGAVLGGEGGASAEVLERIANLVAKSLAVFDRATGRWRLLETIRSYALERLQQEGEAALAAHRQATFFHALFAPDGAHTLGRLQSDNLDRFAAEIDNVRAALDWCFSASGDKGLGAALTAAYGPVWQQLGLIAECRKRTAIAIEGWDASNAQSGLLMQLSLQHAVSSGYALQPQAHTRTAALTALEISERLGDLGGQLHALYLLWASDLLSGKVHRALATAKRFSESASQLGDELRIATAERVLGHALQMQGVHREARGLLELSLARGPIAAPRAFSTWTRFDERAMARAVLAKGLWLQGEPDRAIQEAYGALEDAATDSRGVSQCIVLHLAVCRIDIMLGRFDAAQQSVAMLADISKRHDYPQYLLHADSFDGALLVHSGASERGTAVLRSVYEAGAKSCWTTWFPELLGILAEGFLHLDRLGEAEAAVKEAIERTDDGETWYLPELLRLRGEILVRTGAGDRHSEAKVAFQQSIEAAVDHGALFWELRGALSLAKLIRELGEGEHARAILQPVCAKFAGNVETPDLRLARRMLDAA